MKLTSRKSRNRAATLVDALVAMAIFGVVSVALFGGVSFGFATVNTTREDLRANQILLEKMETIRLYSWEQINTPGFVPTSFAAFYYPPNLANTNGHGAGMQYRGTVTISAGPGGHTYSSEIRTITVGLTWTSNDRTINRNIETLVSRGGLQRYIY